MIAKTKEKAPDYYVFSHCNLKFGLHSRRIREETRIYVVLLARRLAETECDVHGMILCLKIVNWLHLQFCSQNGSN